MAGNFANAADSSILKGIKSRILSYSLQLLVLGSLGGCVTSGIKPIDSYKTTITEPEIVGAYNQDAEMHMKNKEYTSAWDNYVITKNIKGLETILDECFKDAVIHDKIIIEPINKELMAMHRELRKKKCQMEDFEKKVAHQARMYEDPTNSHGSLERAFILYEVIERHSDAERCLILWVNKDNNRYGTAKVMKYYKKFSEEAGFSNFKSEALKITGSYLANPTIDSCESAWIIGEAFGDMEIKKKAVEAGILHGSTSEVWNKRAFEVQEEISQSKQQALKD